MSFLASAARAASRRTFTTSTRLANNSSTARASDISSTIRSSIQRAQAETSDEAFKAGVVYTLLGVSVLSAGYLVVAPKEGRTVSQRDLL